MKRVLLIGNPRAGLRPRDELFEELVQGFERDGLRAEMHRTAGPGEATATARAAADSGGYDAVVAVGGDGTVNEIANGLAGSAVPLGIVPTGTMNILAREAGIPLDPVKAARGLGHLVPIEFCLGLARNRYFVMMAGIGFDAFALDVALKNAGSGKVTFPGYARATTQAAFRYGYAPITVDCEGESFEGTSAIIGNVPRYGGNLRVTPHADPTAADLDLCLIRARGAVGTAMVFGGIVAGASHLKMRAVSYRKGRRFAISSPGGADVLVQLDGEPAGKLPIVIEARPGALRVLCHPLSRAAAGSVSSVSSETGGP